MITLAPNVNHKTSNFPCSKTSGYFYSDTPTYTTVFIIILHLPDILKGISYCDFAVTAPFLSEKYVCP